MLPGREGFGYKEIMGRVGLFSLEHRRLSGGLIGVYKIMRGTDGSSNQSCFSGTELSKA